MLFLWISAKWRRVLESFLTLVEQRARRPSQSRRRRPSVAVRDVNRHRQLVARPPGVGAEDVRQLVRRSQRAVATRHGEQQSRRRRRAIFVDGDQDSFARRRRHRTAEGGADNSSAAAARRCLSSPAVTFVFATLENGTVAQRDDILKGAAHPE